MKNFSCLLWQRTLVCAALLILLPLGGCSEGEKTPRLSSEYQAVFLDTGQVFFGKMEGLGGDYPVLTDIFYVQNQTNPDTRQVASILLKRGGEWHGPDKMVVNARHIIMVEPVATGSRVAELIKQAKDQQPAEPKKDEPARK